MEPVSVLVVTADQARATRWTRWLERSGYLTLTCGSSTSNPDCPRLAGERCSRRQIFDLAVVDLPAGSDCSPLLTCTKLPDDARTVFVADDPPSDRPDGIVVGAQLTPEALVGAVRLAGHGRFVVGD
jgi:hypothetical protein